MGEFATGPSNEALPSVKKGLTRYKKASEGHFERL